MLERHRPSLCSIAGTSGTGSALRGSSRTPDAIGKERIRVCCVLDQSRAAGPDSHLEAQLDVQLSQEDIEGTEGRHERDSSCWPLLRARRICIAF